MLQEISAGKAGNPFQTTQGNRLSCRDQEGRRGSAPELNDLGVPPHCGLLGPFCWGRGADYCGYTDVTGPQPVGFKILPSAEAAGHWWVELCPGIAACVTQEVQGLVLA